MNLHDVNPMWLALPAIVVFAALCLITWQWVRRKRKPKQPPAPDLEIDVSRLDSTGPPEEGPGLEFYGTPVRLAVVVVAPGGRGGELPPPDVLPGLMEQIVPGMTVIVAQHKPLILRWPAQLSSHGFAQSFFNKVALPGTRGKGTPWCSIAGKTQVGNRFFLVGLVFSSGSANSLSQVMVQHEGQWLDILRIRGV